MSACKCHKYEGGLKGPNSSWSEISMCDLRNFPDHLKMAWLIFFWFINEILCPWETTNSSSSKHVRLVCLIVITKLTPVCSFHLLVSMVPRSDGLIRSEKVRVSVSVLGCSQSASSWIVDEWFLPWNSFPS